MIFFRWWSCTLSSSLLVGVWFGDVWNGHCPKSNIYCRQRPRFAGKSPQRSDFHQVLAQKFKDSEPENFNSWDSAFPRQVEKKQNVGQNSVIFRQFSLLLLVWGHGAGIDFSQYGHVSCKYCSDCPESQNISRIAKIDIQSHFSVC